MKIDSHKNDPIIKISFPLNSDDILKDVKVETQIKVITFQLSKINK